MYIQGNKIDNVGLHFCLVVMASTLIRVLVDCYYYIHIDHSNPFDHNMHELSNLIWILVSNCYCSSLIFCLYTFQLYGVKLNLLRVCFLLQYYMNLRTGTKFFSRAALYRHFRRVAAQVKTFTKILFLIGQWTILVCLYKYIIFLYILQVKWVHRERKLAQQRNSWARGGWNVFKMQRDWT